MQLNQHEKNYIVMLMESIFNGEYGRKIMLREYFNKESTNDFTKDEARVAVHLLLNQREELIRFYDNYINSYTDVGERKGKYIPKRR